MSFREFISKHKQLRLDAGLLRELQVLDSPQGVRVKRDGHELINFSSNDYLGLANSNELKQAAAAAIDQWGVGAAASHLVCGHQQPHQCLEEEVAEFVGAEKAIVFSSGYMTNLAIPNALLTRQDLFLQDKLNHASLIDAGLLCRASAKRFRHLDINHAASLIERTEAANVLLATDGVFSMDGEIADVVSLSQICHGENHLLLVDDAHGFGVLGDRGAGTLERAGLVVGGQVLMVGTLSKAIGGFGAFAAGDRSLIDHLIQHARSYIYTTALPPAIVEANRASLRLIKTESWRREKLAENVSLFRSLAAVKQIELLPSPTAIQSVMFSSATRAVQASRDLEDAGFLVVAIRPPTVPEGSSRLRITLSAEHQESNIRALVDALDI